MDLKQKVALITGSAKRIGKALALALAKEGCHLIIHYGRSKEAAQETVSEIKALGVDAWAISADLNDETEIKSIIPFAVKQAGGVDILINNASIFPEEDFFEANSESWDRNMMIHLKSPFLLSQAFARTLPEDQPGKIINMLDVVALRPRNHHFSYTVSKAALAMLTQATAHALAARNIQVNGLALGAILPSVNDEEEKFKKLAKSIPVQRTGSPKEVTQAMLYLLKAGDYITGEIIRVDGGKHLV